MKLYATVSGDRGIAKKGANDRLSIALQHLIGNDSRYTGPGSLTTIDVELNWNNGTPELFISLPPMWKFIHNPAAATDARRARATYVPDR